MLNTKIFTSIFICLAAILSVSACTHKIPVEQGNIVTPEMLGNLSEGMTFQEVKQQVGSPLITEQNGEKWIYYYNRNTRADDKQFRRVEVTFDSGVVTEIVSAGDFDSEWTGDKQSR